MHRLFAVALLFAACSQQDSSFLDSVDRDRAITIAGESKTIGTVISEERRRIEANPEMYCIVGRAMAKSLLADTDDTRILLQIADALCLEKGYKSLAD